VTCAAAPRLVLALLLAATAGPSGGAPDYHEPAVAAPSAIESAAWKLLASRVGKGFKRDAALTLAARDLCRAVHETGGDALDAKLVTKVMLARGVTDVTVAPLVMSASDAGTLLDSLESRLDEDAQSCAGRTVGLGSETLDGRSMVAILSVDRILDLEPVPRSIEVEGEVGLGGRKAAKVDDLRVLVATPGGDVLAPTLSVTGKKLAAVLELRSGEGVYVVELLGDTGLGPRVLNMFPVAVGHGGGIASVVLSVPWRDGPGRNAWMLFDLIAADRLDRGLPALRPDVDLAIVALDHSRDMRDAGYFGHVSPSHGSIEERSAHVPGIVKVAELIALAKTPQRAFGNLIASPAHMAAIRDPDVTHMGVGKVETDEGMLFTVVLAGREP
jgi:hypothetical protein